MNLKKYLSVIIAMMMVFGVSYSVDSYAAEKKAASSSQSTSKNSKGSSKDSSAKNASKNNSKDTKSSSKDSKSSSKDTKSSSKDSKSSSKDSKGSSKDTKSNSKDSKDTKSNSKDSKSASKDTKNKKDTAADKKSSGKNSKNKDANLSVKNRKDPAPATANARSKSKERKSYSGASQSKSNSSASKETASNDSLTLLVNDALTKGISLEINPGNLRVNSAKPNMNNRTLSVQLNENFTYLPVNKELISDFEKRVKHVLPDSLANFRVNFNVGNNAYSYYINTLDKLPEKYRDNVSFVRPALPYNSATKGMEGDIVAMWHSHGRYYKPGSGWAWQRPFLFQTAEDVYTMSYVLPFIVPMLENAGAYVMLPRERDVNKNEVIVDRDTDPDGVFSQTTYKEQNGSKKWEDGEFEGFIYDLARFRDTENPFEAGTYRQVETVKNGKNSVAGWYADLPEDGEYAVYVSYKSLPNSTSDAHYIVNYDGGKREFVVNQQMGGGTWIYLGTFPFRKGSAAVPVVELSNMTNGHAGTLVTADAVKIGGGMGNIERSSSRRDVTWDYGEEEIVAQAPAQPEDEDLDDGQAPVESDEEGQPQEESTRQSQPSQSKPSTKKSGKAPSFSTSGLPRFLEGARYWLHWAGFPESVYSRQGGSDDYKDDYKSRGYWVNYLAGGSRVLPNQKGLGIPVDVAFALHTDAGMRSDESIVGTLGIYFTDGGRNYADGTPRKNSRILTDMVMRQVVGDIRHTFEPNWTRRQMWDKSYAEAHTPEVPTMLLELLSHQNFADMRYGLDPTFRFTVSRAIYKGIGRFVAERKGRKFIVQPLPVEAFAITREKKGVFRLSWRPVEDPLEPSATPTKYIIFERKEGSQGFVKIDETKNTHYQAKVADEKIHSYYVVAANEGGMSFPSETLSLKEGNGNPVLIVNGFTRISAPESFVEGMQAGFRGEEDFGVPYKQDISFTGYQTNFSRSSGDAFGRSNSNHVTTIVGGNTFDYPAVHGAAIASAGRGFVSCSAMAVEDGMVNLADYPVVDLILGKQKQIDVGGSRSKRKNLFATFPEALQKKISAYVEKGGKLIVSGQNISSDLYSSKAPKGSADFAANTLGLADSQSREGGGKVNVVILNGLEGSKMNYANTLRQDYYIVEKADVLQPVDEYIDTFLTFPNGKTAGFIIDRGKGVVAVMSIPFESFTDSTQASRLMRELLNELKN